MMFEETWREEDWNSPRGRVTKAIIPEREREKERESEHKRDRDMVLYCFVWVQQIDISSKRKCTSVYVSLYKKSGSCNFT